MLSSADEFGVFNFVRFLTNCCIFKWESHSRSLLGSFAFTILLVDSLFWRSDFELQDGTVGWDEFRVDLCLPVFSRHKKRELSSLDLEESERDNDYDYGSHPFLNSKYHKFLPISVLDTSACDPLPLILFLVRRKFS